MSTTEDQPTADYEAPNNGTEERPSQKHPRYDVDRWDERADPSDPWVPLAVSVEVPSHKQDTPHARREAIKLATQDLDLEMQYGTFRLTPLREGEAKVHTRTQVLQDDWS